VAVVAAILPPQMGRARTLGASAVILLAGILFATACSGSGAEVTGTVNKLDRSALPPNAVVTVELRDTSRADAPAVTLANDVIELGGDQLPVPYTLSYDENDIDDRNTYTVFVRIEAEGRLQYITDTAYPVITRDAPTEDVEVFVVQTG
jgi:putative lipoprotein